MGESYLHLQSTQSNTNTSNPHNLCHIHNALYINICLPNRLGLRLLFRQFSRTKDDPHAADWLTGTWLEEQLNGQRRLAGLINTSNNFKRGHDELAEWMFDQEL